MARELPDVAPLELLVGIDDRGRLGAASRALGMARPNASRAIRQLERRLGMPLVERSPRGSTLTAG
jgi:DNA-binding transcriptional LysR family regulator